MKKGRIRYLLCVAFFTVGPLIALLNEKKPGFDDYLGWIYIITVWAAFPFGCVTDNMASRKGYSDKFVYGFWFGILGFLYWSFVPAAWDHPEYIQSTDIRRLDRNHSKIDYRHRNR